MVEANADGQSCRARLRIGLRCLLACGILVASPSPWATAAAGDEPRSRPTEWAQPVLGTALKNLHQVSPDLFRSSQPDAKDVKALKALGVQSVINLRDHHDDRRIKGFDAFRLGRVEMNAGKVKPEELLEALRLVRDAPKPALVHCWHGSDRTGVVVAAYRMIFQGWSREAAKDEFVNGEFGYHARIYPNLLTLLDSIDAAEWRQVLELELPEEAPHSR
jgi:protein tyrosine phosphatase (PTP) superfamily phosphohydrolase (DUF442 family)